jgi:hypothetical protein
MANTIDGTHRTSDLYYAAYLKVAGITLQNVEHQGRRAIYIFEAPHNIDELKMAFFNRTAKVVAMTLIDEIKAMKALTYLD